MINSMTDTVKLAIELVSRPSITPNDFGCQYVLVERLKQLGFKIEHLKFGDVDNLWLRRGASSPVLAFAGHTDVVPPGDESLWNYHPFEPTIDDFGRIYGRGIADMKGAIAAMVTACEQFIQQYPNHKGSIAFLITSDEEGAAINGTRKVIEKLEERNEKIDWCIVGEPSSKDRLGDTVKNGRRGSMHGELIVYGEQGHIAYPHLARNPIHELSKSLSVLVNENWDQGNQYFQPTSFQIWNIESPNSVSNVIPATASAKFNFRFSTEISSDEIESRVCGILNKFHSSYDIKWIVSGEPFLTSTSQLTKAVKEAIKEEVDIDCEFSTSGGTSDGRFIAPTGTKVVELGTVSKTIHKVNENIAVEELNQLHRIYHKILTKLLVIL